MQRHFPQINIEKNPCKRIKPLNISLAALQYFSLVNDLFNLNEMAISRFCLATMSAKQFFDKLH